MASAKTGNGSTAAGTYEIRVKGHVEDRWADWFTGMEVVREDDGTTLLRGEVADQSALHGVLATIRDLGLPVLSVERVSRPLMTAVVHERYGGPEVLEVRRIERPGVKPKELLIRVRAAGVDRGVWHLMAGEPYLIRLMGYGLRRPKNAVVGMDFAGVVEAVGSDVEGFQRGDEVFGTSSGSFAEYTVVGADRAVPKPRALSFEQAAAIPVSGLAAYQAVRREADVQPGQHVLVIGASGGVGTYAVQIAKAAGATVTGVCSTSKVDFVRSLGADHVIDYTQGDFAGGKRYHAVLDIAGNRPLSQLRRALAPDGTLVIVGGEQGGRLLGGQLRPLGASLLSPFIKQRLRWQLPKDQPGDLAQLKDLVDTGKVVPALDRTFALHEAREAVRYLLQGQVRGKVAITI